MNFAESYRSDVKVKNFVDPLQITLLEGRDCARTLRRGYALTLKAAIDTMWPATPVLWLAAGTALGFRRERDFISEDTDIDVHIALDYRNKKLCDDFATRVERYLCESSFKLIRTAAYFGRFTQKAFYDTVNDNLVYDIMIFYNNSPPYDSPTKYCNYTKVGLQTMDADMIDNVIFDYFSFGVYPMPPDSYFPYRYGPTWRQRINSKKNFARAVPEPTS